MGRIGTMMWFMVVLLVMPFLMVWAKKYGKTEEEYSREIGYDIGNIQSLGNCQQQNDYFATIPRKNGLLAVVADGLTDRVQGKYASVVAVEILKGNLAFLENYGSQQDFFQYSFGKIAEHLRKNGQQNQTGVAVAALFAEKKQILWAVAGGCQIYRYRQGEVKEVNQREQQVSYGSFPKQKGDCLLLCTEGVFQSITELELQEILATKVSSQQKAELLQKRIYQKAYIYQKNATAIVLAY